MLTLYDLSVNAVKDPTYIPYEDLTLGWKLDSDRTDVLQTSYRIVITTTAATVYDSGMVASDASVHIPLPVMLASRTDHTITVSVTDNHGDAAKASLAVHTAIAPHEWEAQWIKPRRHIEGWAPYLRTKFQAAAGVASAHLYVCGLGCGEYYINGEKVSEDMIDPPFTNYEREVLYRVYNVKHLLGEKNALAAWLGEGWYSQSRVWGNRGMKYGDCCLIARLEIEYENGERQVITTNTEDWTYKYSPISLNNLYGGETYDCRLETPDFASPDGEEEEWGSVVEDVTPRGTLRLCEMPPIRHTRTLPAVSVKRVSGKNDGAWIVDFGENIAGMVELHTPPSPRGAQYTLRFAETVGPDGALDHRSIGAFATQCIQQDVYIARGDAEGEVFRPRFTYHAFRYMEITGYHDLRAYGTDPDLTVAVCHVITTDLAPIGRFESSHEDLNHLRRLMMSTYLSNYHGFPEDCPGREKCGWLGDAQVVCNLGLMNFDAEASYLKYMRDIRDSESVYGTWQMIAPGKRGCGEASPLWGCANVLIPYWLYRYCGNESVVREHWAMMERWMHHEMEDAKKGASKTGSDYIITRGLGDWCTPVGNASPRRMPVPESSTAMFYETALRMAEMARALDLPASHDYDELAANIKCAFNQTFWLPELHRYGTWGTCGVALQTGLFPDGEEEALLDALLSLMQEDDYAMPTAIYCNKYLVPALCERGYGDLALKFLFNRDHVSFGTMMDDGATSVWECLEMRGSGQPREKDCASYNHPMHTGFGYFMHAHVGGISPILPGFKEFAVSPCYFGDIPSATVTHTCPYGEIKVAFERLGDETTYHITVPANTTAYWIGGDDCERLGSGEHRLVRAV